MNDDAREFLFKLVPDLFKLYKVTSFFIHSCTLLKSLTTSSNKKTTFISHLTHIWRLWESLKYILKLLVPVNSSWYLMKLYLHIANFSLNPDILKKLFNRQANILDFLNLFKAFYQSVESPLLNWSKLMILSPKNGWEDKKRCLKYCLSTWRQWSV